MEENLARDLSLYPHPIIKVAQVQCRDQNRYSMALWPLCMDSQIACDAGINHHTMWIWTVVERLHTKKCSRKGGKGKRRL
jgi:hypothetical protein